MNNIQNLEVNSIDSTESNDSNENENIDFYKRFDTTGYGDYYLLDDNEFDDNEFDDDFFEMINEIENEYDYDSDGYYFNGFDKRYEYDEYDD